MVWKSKKYENKLRISHHFEKTGCHFVSPALFPHPSSPQKTYKQKKEATYLNLHMTRSKLVDGRLVVSPVHEPWYSVSNEQSFFV